MIAIGRNVPHWIADSGQLLQYGTMLLTLGIILMTFVPLPPVLLLACALLLLVCHPIASSLERRAINSIVTEKCKYRELAERPLFFRTGVAARNRACFVFLALAVALPAHLLLKIDRSVVTALLGGGLLLVTVEWIAWRVRYVIDGSRLTIEWMKGLSVCERHVVELSNAPIRVNWLTATCEIGGANPRSICLAEFWNPVMFVRALVASSTADQAICEGHGNAEEHKGSNECVDPHDVKTKDRQDMP